MLAVVARSGKALAQSGKALARLEDSPSLVDNYYQTINDTIRLIIVLK